jgi:hypothetical protein
MDDTFLGTAILIYGHQTTHKALEDLIYIECSSTKKFLGRLAQTNRGTEEDKPTRFIINPNDKSVRRWDKSRFGEVQRYSDEEIVTTWSTEKNSFTLRLDRRAGSYLIEGRFKDDSRTGLDIWGKCARTTPDKKF